MIHRAHDYRDLVRRWRLVCKAAGVRLRPFAEAGDFKIYRIRTESIASTPGVYVSAGIHGDEPATTEALITWAERNTKRLAKLPLFLFPCLNPWGLALNIRLNEAGVDLNRAFDRNDVPVTNAMRELLRGSRFIVALHLHEDYDAQGIYLYEIHGELPYLGDTFLNAARQFLPIDPRTKIDTGRARSGVIRRRLNARHYARLGGLPEAVYLHRHHTRYAITFETPSELGLAERVEAHVAVIDAAVEHMLASTRAQTH